MSAVADRTPIVNLLRARSATRALTRDAMLKLVPSEDGWSLVRGDGALAFRAAGRSARQACLEHAATRGVLAVLS